MYVQTLLKPAWEGETSHHIFLAIIRLDKNYWKNVKSGQPQFASGTIINHCYQTRNNFFADYWNTLNFNLD